MQHYNMLLILCIIVPLQSLKLVKLPTALTTSVAKDVEAEDTDNPANHVVPWNELDKLKLSFGDGCPDSQHPKLAVCIAGLSRSLVSSATTTRLISKIIEPAMQAGALGVTRRKPDIFVHVKAGSNTEAELNAAVAALEATNSTIEIGDGAHEMVANPSCLWQRPNKKKRTSGDSMSYYKSIYGCYQMLTDVESREGIKFDHVIFMRPDHQWATSTEVTPEGSSAGGADNVSNRIQCSKSFYGNDQYSFQTRKGFERFGNIYKDQFLNPSPSICNMKDNMGHSEDVLRNCVADMNQQNPNSAMFNGGCEGCWETCQ